MNFFRRVIAYLFRPFASLIRYAALKTMKKLRQPDDDRPIRAAASHIVDTIALPSSFSIFRDRTFREHVAFGSLPTVEQDRIFNELVTTGVCVVLFCLEWADALVPPEAYHFWRDVREQVPHEFESQLVGLGIAAENAALYKKLISDRYNEYGELTRDVRDMWSVEEPQFRSLPTDSAKQSVARVHAIALGTADHIRRGTMRKGDPLPDFLRSWLLRLDERVSSFIYNL